MNCNRHEARYHGDERYVGIACTCGTCATDEAACDWLDWLAMQHNSQEEQRDWYKLVELFGYDLPQPIWAIVQGEMQAWRQHDAEMAERAAGWDPNP